MIVTRLCPVQSEFETQQEQEALRLHSRISDMLWVIPKEMNLSANFPLVLKPRMCEFSPLILVSFYDMVSN